jgi:hypothetical protein
MIEERYPEIAPLKPVTIKVATLSPETLAECQREAKP